MEIGINEYWIGLYSASAITVGYLFYLARAKIKDLTTLYELEKTKSQSKLKERLENLSEVDKYLDEKLEKLFQMFIYKNILYTLRQYATTLSEDTKNKARQEFIEYVEFNSTPEEKKIFEQRYGSFSLFKFILITFFNIKLTKLELFICHKMSIDEKEFKDYKLFESIYDQLSRKDIENILDMFQDEEPEKNKANKLKDNK